MGCSKIQEKFKEGGNGLQGMFYFVNIYAAEVFIFCVGIDFALKIAQCNEADKRKEV